MCHMGTLLLDAEMTRSIYTNVSDRLQLLRRELQIAECDHAAGRRSTCEGATGSALDTDSERWFEVGLAIAALARLIHTSCVTSDFCSVRPDTDVLAARISEAIDDQLDEQSWTLVNAVARLEAARTPDLSSREPL